MMILRVPFHRASRIPTLRPLSQRARCHSTCCPTRRPRPVLRDGSLRSSLHTLRRPLTVRRVLEFVQSSSDSDLDVRFGTTLFWSATLFLLAARPLLPVSPSSLLRRCVQHMPPSPTSPRPSERPSHERHLSGDRQGLPARPTRDNNDAC